MLGTGDTAVEAGEDLSPQETYVPLRSLHSRKREEGRGGGQEAGTGTARWLKPPKLKD